MKVTALASLSSLMCKLKSPRITVLLCVERRSVVKFENSSINVLFIILFFMEYGGWYIPVTVSWHFLTVILHVVYSKELVDPFLMHFTP